MPKEHSKWWRDKIEANQRRDLDTERRLADAGWKLVVVWEHDDPTSAADEIEVELESAFKGSP
jgi:DNA mismatch endonuclease (patch repair protein)